MQKPLRLTLVAVVTATASLTCAHANDLQNLLRALGKAVDEQVRQESGRSAPAPTPQADGAPPTTGGFNRVGRNVDTPENLDLLKSKVRARIEASSPSQTNELALMQLCEEEMRPLSAFKTVIGTGYDELRAKCEMAAQEPIREFQERQIASARQRRESEATAAAAHEADKKAQEEREYTRAMAELRAGKRQPVNCQQWVAANGQDPRTLDAPITEVAYQPPQGIGHYSGRVEQINGDTMLLSDQPILRMRGTPQGYMVVTLARAKIFHGAQIKVGTVVEGFASQTGSRTMRMTDGSGQQAPVLLATCMNALF
jgi:hypothetical protein